jgi:hypothetical protein
MDHDNCSHAMRYATWVTILISRSQHESTQSPATSEPCNLKQRIVEETNVANFVMGQGDGLRLLLFPCVLQETPGYLALHQLVELR